MMLRAEPDTGRFVSAVFGSTALRLEPGRFPDRILVFQPVLLAVLFVFGGWFALGGSIEARPLIRSRALLWLGSAYLPFALIMTMAGRFPEIAHMIPPWLYGAFNPNDKTNLEPYRLVHFIVLAFFINRFLPRDWRGLEWPIFRPLIKCGQQSLEVFCVGVFLAGGHTSCSSKFPTRSGCKSQLVSSVSPC